MKNKIYLTPEDVEISLANTPQITFEITDACNLNCTYCVYGELYADYDVRKNVWLAEQKAIFLLEYLNNLWQSNFNTSFHKNIYISFYGGEPLMNMKFIKKIVDYIENQINSKTRIFTFTMTTNALLLHKNIDYLMEHHFDLLISLDGDKQNTAYRIDKQGNEIFDKVVAILDFIKNQYPDYFNKHINFNAVLHNKNSVESIYSFFKKKYNKIPAIGNLNNTGIRPDKRNEFIKMYRNVAENLFDSEHYSDIERDMFINAPSYDSAAKFLLTESEFIYNDYNELLYGKKVPSKKWITGTCVPFSKKIFLTVNGKILPCERISQHFGLGEIDDNGIHLDFQAIAEKYTAYFSKIDTRCASCYNKKACFQCIFNLSDIDELSPHCFGYMTKNDFEFYKQSQLNFFRRQPEAYSRIMKELITE
jgi:uncharacterized protein